MADLSKIKLNGIEYDLKDSYAREAIANIPEDKIFPVNVTLTSMTQGTSDKSHIEILAAVNAGKIPFVYIDYSGSKMIASLLFANSNRVSFVYDNQVDEGFGSYAFLQIQNSNAIIIWKDKYITQNDLPTLSSVAISGDYNDLTNKPTIPDVPAWALAVNKPTYSFSELTSHPTTINDYGITDAYTKTEVNGLISSVLHYKGTKSTTSALPSNGNTTGDVWHITADGSEWAWDGTNWQELGTAVDLSAYRTAADQDLIDQKQNAALDEMLPAGGNAYRAVSIPMGHLDSTSTATVMTATVDGITELRDGVCVWLRNNVVASASGVTLNINSLGAKPIYNSLAGTVVTTTFAKAATYLFVYNSTRISGGCWDMVYGYDTNTTYSPAKLGQGYAVCNTAAATAAKTASISSYALVTGGIVAIKFENDVPAKATLNITSKGAKAIYYKGAAIGANVIKAGDTVTMIYSTYYHVLSIDRAADAYHLPADGIPISDLASTIQTSLGKADTALQSYTETDPIFTASAAAGISSTDISNWNAKSDFSGSYNDLEDKPNLSTFMVKGTDYVTAGKKTGTTLGNKATAEGYNTTASGNFSHAEGDNTVASEYGSHAEGQSTTASEYGSHAEGQSTTASGYCSHAEGYNTVADRHYSHAEGDNTTASGDSSHAEGDNTTASGSFSHAEGNSTTAQRKSQHVFGEYNILDTTGTTATRGQYVEIVGNGTRSARSNARTLDWSGNEVLAGKLTIGTTPTADMDVTTKQYVDSAITTAIGGINQFEVAIVTDLPTANIDAHTIYFKSNSSSGNNVYDEYIYINNNWELIGSTQVDLSNYLQTSDIAAWAKAANKPTYTAAEVGALPDTTVIPAAQVNSDWNATSGVAQILNKPTIPEAETDANVENMLDSFNLDYTSNTTSSNYANGVSF